MCVCVTCHITPDGHSINGVSKSVVTSQSHSHRHNCTPLDHCNTESHHISHVALLYTHVICAYEDMAMTTSANLHACFYVFWSVEEYVCVGVCVCVCCLNEHYYILCMILPLLIFSVCCGVQTCPSRRVTKKLFREKTMLASYTTLPAN